MEELKADIREIKIDVREIKTEVTANRVGLDYHIKRTALSERRIEVLERWLLGLLGSATVALIIRALAH